MQQQVADRVGRAATVIEQFIVAGVTLLNDILRKRIEQVEEGLQRQLMLFDFGMSYNTGFRSIRLGISVQNLGRQVEFSQEGHPAPLMFRLGAAADLLGPDALLGTDAQNRVTLAYDILQPNDYQQQMHAGLEYCYGGMFALRGGYKFNYDSDGLTLGAGVMTDLLGPALRFDYSYGRMGDYLGTAHRLSLGVTIP